VSWSSVIGSTSESVSESELSSSLPESEPVWSGTWEGAERADEEPDETVKGLGADTGRVTSPSADFSSAGKCEAAAANQSKLSSG